MKTQKTISARAATAAMMISALIMITACGTKRDGSNSDKGQSPEPQETVTPPAMDIHTATVLGDQEAIQQHIAAGSDLNEREPTMGSSPLISAAVFGKTEVARLLIEAGADVNLQNKEGSTALHPAAFLCRTEIVKMLLDNGADRELLNIYGSTALASVAGPFSDVKPIYDQFSKDLGPFGFKLDYAHLESERPVIAALLQQ